MLSVIPLDQKQTKLINEDRNQDYYFCNSNLKQMKNNGEMKIGFSMIKDKKRTSQTYAKF